MMHRYIYLDDAGPCCPAERRSHARIVPVGTSEPEMPRAERTRETKWRISSGPWRYRQERARHDPAAAARSCRRARPAGKLPGNDRKARNGAAPDGRHRHRPRPAPHRRDVPRERRAPAGASALSQRRRRPEARERHQGLRAVAGRAARRHRHGGFGAADRGHADGGGARPHGTRGCAAPALLRPLRRPAGRPARAVGKPAVRARDRRGAARPAGRGAGVRSTTRARS